MSGDGDSRQLPEAARLIREAHSLGIPWQDILEAEIRAERLLGAIPAEGDGEPPLDVLLALLPHSALESWRIRSLIDRLSWQARPGSGNGREARRELRTLGRWLLGGLSAPSALALASHLLLAHRRVRELLAICRAAARPPGTEEEQIARVRQKTRCADNDAHWAVRRETERRLPRLDDAMRRVRSEGFEIPRGRTEAEAFLRMRAFLERRGLLPAGCRRRTTGLSEDPSGPPQVIGARRRVRRA